MIMNPIFKILVRTLEGLVQVCERNIGKNNVNPDLFTLKVAYVYSRMLLSVVLSTYV